jgi:hypothetical protein
MFRSILSVVVGYLVLAVLVMLATAPVFLAPELAFQKDSVEPSLTFTVWNLIMSLVAAVAGGLVCALVAGKKRRIPVLVFAGLVLVIGLAMALSQPVRHDLPPGEEIARMTVMERASHAHEPAWYSYLLPFVGCAGVLAGGSWRRQQYPEPACP